MKLIIQIPCFNEEDNLEKTIRDLPREIDGIDQIEIMVVDDGSSDRTVELAGSLGVDHVVTHTGNKGLARTFRTGVDAALKRGADIIVNTDGDNQYFGGDIAGLVEPIVKGEAEIVVGDRGGFANPHFSLFKRQLQVLGSLLIRKITGLEINDAVSGFRAISRQAAMQINIVTDFSYTIEMLVQASAKRLKVVSIPVQTNAKTRESRLFKSIPQFLKMSVATLVRSYTMYKPLRVFTIIGVFLMLAGAIPISRFLYFYLTDGGSGHIQSIVLGASLTIMGAATILIGMVADLIHFNRKLIELVLVKVSAIEFEIERDGTKDTKVDRTKILKELNEINIKVG